MSGDLWAEAPAPQPIIWHEDAESEPEIEKAYEAPKYGPRLSITGPRPRFVPAPPPPPPPGIFVPEPKGAVRVTPVAVLHERFRRAPFWVSEILEIAGREPAVAEALARLALVHGAKPAGGRVHVNPWGVALHLKKAGALEEKNPRGPVLWFPKAPEGPAKAAGDFTPGSVAEILLEGLQAREGVLWDEGAVEIHLTSPAPPAEDLWPAEPADLWAPVAEQGRLFVVPPPAPKGGMPELW